MYILFGVLVFLVLSLCIITCYRRKKIICKVQKLDRCIKIRLVNDLLKPFGFAYRPQQDLVTSRREAWQRGFGYRGLFDRSALSFGMVFDCEPVYFYHGDRTYLIELWKGQYGISMGGEIGIYYAQGILEPDQLKNAHFHSVPDEEMLFCRMNYFCRGQEMFVHEARHWWLTGFRPGAYCEPEDVVLHVSIAFREQDMMLSFVGSLLRMGYRECDMKIRDLTVSWQFARPYSCQPNEARHLRVRFAQWKNRRFCHMFRRLTRPFTCTSDRILYLYFFLPAAFRHMFGMRRSRCQKFRIRREKMRVHEL